MNDDKLIEQAIQGHAGTREAMRWLVRQVRAETIREFVAAAVFPSAPLTHDEAVREGMGRPGDGNG